MERLVSGVGIDGPTLSRVIGEMGRFLEDSTKPVMGEDTAL